MNEYIEKIKNVKSLSELDELKVLLFGKNGVMTEKLKSLGSMSADERKIAGVEINKEKDELLKLLTEKNEVLAYEKMMAELKPQKIDVSRPISRLNSIGKLHPLTHVMQQMYSIMSNMGFSPVTGPEIEDDYHNFTALNISPNHPARDMQDSFYFSGDTLLRTQTSAVQIRALEKYGAPIKIFSIGNCYRREIDATHTPMFHQMEGLQLGKNITMNNLVGIVREFIKVFFDVDDVPMRIRPSYFPFTEPSIEFDVKWNKKTGTIGDGEGSSWIEMGGAGMVHPNVIKNAGLNPDEVQGFAFGFGVDRFAMLKYGIPDIRNFFRGDIRWLEHYGFDFCDVPNVSTGLDK